MGQCPSKFSLLFLWFNTHVNLGCFCCGSIPIENQMLLWADTHPIPTCCADGQYPCKFKFFSLLTKLRFGTYLNSRRIIMDQYLSRLYLMVSEVNTHENSSLNVAGGTPSQLIKFIWVAAYLTIFR